MLFFILIELNIRTNTVEQWLRIVSNKLTERCKLTFIDFYVTNIFIIASFIFNTRSNNFIPLDVYEVIKKTGY